jgi:hypothetical protein
VAPRRIFVAVLVLGAASATAACDKPDDDTTAATGCAATVRDASRAVEVAEQVDLLDRAMVRCRSLDELTAEMSRYPGIVGYELSTFVALRCTKVTDEAVRSSPACASLVAPATTVNASVASVAFVGETLDGRTIEIRPDADTAFVGDVPAAVQQTVDIAIESGCEGVRTQRDLWAARVGEAGIGDEASVYAEHAQRVADYIGCALPALTTGEEVDPSSPSSP